MIEVWKDVIGYEGIYQVSNFGNLKRLKGTDDRGNLRNERILNPRTIKGYKVAHLCKDGVAENKLVHRLVAESFIPNINFLPEVNHIDGNKQNNQIDNLEWVSKSENAIHAFKLGLRTPNKTMLGKVGELNPNSKKVMCVETTIIYSNSHFAGLQTGANESHIRECCRGERKTCNGYHWRYVH